MILRELLVVLGKIRIANKMLLIVFVMPAYAQIIPTAPDPSQVPNGVRISNALYETVLAKQSQYGGQAPAAYIEQATHKGITVRKDGKVFVEIIGPQNGKIIDDLNIDELRSRGVEIARQDRKEKVLADGHVLVLEPLSL